MHDDRELTCVDCGASFVFTAGEQQFYEERGFNSPPRRCKECRKQRKAGGGAPGGGGGGGDRHGSRGGGGGGGGNRPSFTAVCSACGAETTVPFEPDPSRAIFCRPCYQQRKK